MPRGGICGNDGRSPVWPIAFSGGKITFFKNGHLKSSSPQTSLEILKRHLLQEQIAFYEDRENLERKFHRSGEFPDESQSREEIETEWKESLERLRLMLDELKGSPEEEK